jgi:hypothetical protein
MTCIRITILFFAWVILLTIAISINEPAMVIYLAKMIS